MKKVKFERRGTPKKLVPTINYIAKTANTKQEAVNRLSDILPQNIKVGFGGSHVWAANERNERLFIIEGY